MRTGHGKKPYRKPGGGGDRSEQHEGMKTRSVGPSAWYLGMVIARLDGKGLAKEVDPLVKGRRANEGVGEPVGETYPQCVRSDCPCSSTCDDTVGQYCSYACAHWGSCAENYHPISWKRREQARQSGKKAQTMLGER